VRKCLVIAHGVHESGRREVIGLDCGECETEAFWREFLGDLVKRGLTGCQPVVSDAHEGLKTAIAQVLGAPWQRCTVHRSSRSGTHNKTKRRRSSSPRPEKPINLPTSYTTSWDLDSRLRDVTRRSITGGR
jgi:transposase-like protein